MPLPGKQAQMKMAPKADLRDRMEIPPGIKHNGVLILLHKTTVGLSLLYTLRSDYLAAHRGQICFPGGGAEHHETLLETAARELREEVGINVSADNVLGGLTSLYVPPSGNIIHPFVAYLEKLPDITLQQEEVSEAFGVSIDRLANHDNLKNETWSINEKPYNVPFWDIHRIPLWGATAMITSELLTLYEEFLKHPT